MKNLKFNTKKITAIIGMSLGLSLVGGCSNKKDDKNLVDMVSRIKDTTCLDEIMTDSELSKVDDLLEYIELSEILNTMGVKSVNIDLDQFTLMSPFEIKKLIAIRTNKDASKYLSSDELSKVNTDLSIEMGLINDYILNGGYILGEDFLVNVLKSEVLDASDLNEESYDDINILSVDKYGIKSNFLGYSEDVFLTDNIKTRDRGIINALNMLYVMQNVCDYNSNEYSAVEYNEARNEIIRSAVKKGMEIIPKNYTMNKGFLKKTRK